MNDEYLKGKTKEQIRACVESDEEFVNKDFLQMVLKIHPEKFDQVINIVPLCNLSCSIFDIIKLLLKGDRGFICNSIISMTALLYCLNLCGIDNSNIEFVYDKKKEMIMFRIKTRDL